ncbi:hypothetical protein SSCG_06090 [Streptomyces clavuligerus]|nr:hypothetical protein SSCG_06090 [Streptomyces clavuligerus]
MLSVEALSTQSQAESIAAHAIGRTGWTGRLDRTGRTRRTGRTERSDRVDRAYEPAYG